MAQVMKNTKNQSLFTFLLFPGIAMLLGWGLRGYIGGGPFGAMIPGAMVALAISMLLGYKPNFTALVVVFGLIGVGLGGEMTYGQTLGFLRNPDTVWWGILATTVKGAVWGIGGGALLALGLLHRQVPKKTIIFSLIVLLIGLIIGFKLINDPKLIYFSDPINKPRSESWAGLLFGSLALIGYLKLKIEKDDFRIIFRFAKWGLISGGLGFGLGGLWFVLGTNLGDVMFTSWWKMMEFTFGLLFGMGLGYAAWENKAFLTSAITSNEESADSKLWKEMGYILLISFGVYFVFPALMEPLADQMSSSDSWILIAFGNFLRILVNYAFYGLIMLLIVLYRNELAWQIGITLTFCHTAIDWARDLKPTPETSLEPWIQGIVVLVATSIVAYLVAIYRRRTGINNSMVQILVWSTIFVAFVSLASDIFIEDKFQYTDIASIIVKTLFVHIVFLSSAIYTSVMSSKISALEK